MKKLPYVIIRADRAGAFAWYLEKRKGSEVILKQCRRLWFWKGASSLSQLVVDGTKDPAGCKFPVAVPRAEILGVIEVLEVSEAARLSIASVPEWKQ
jgi:hypothetical protein